jgi:uncharacterized membrane protein YgcG
MRPLRLSRHYARLDEHRRLTPRPRMAAAQPSRRRAPRCDLHTTFSLSLSLSLASTPNRPSLSPSLYVPSRSPSLILSTPPYALPPPPGRPVAPRPAPHRAAISMVTAPLLQPMSRHRRPANQARSSTASRGSSDAPARPPAEGGGGRIMGIEGAGGGGGSGSGGGGGGSSSSDVRTGCEGELVRSGRGF